MPKNDLNEFLSDTGSNALISLIGAVVRLAYVKEGDWRVQCTTFFGGFAFGVLVGFLIKDNGFLSAYSNAIVAVSALLGKDAVNLARKKLPVWLPLLPLFFTGGIKAFAEALRNAEKETPKEEGEDENA